MLRSRIPGDESGKREPISMWRTSVSPHRLVRDLSPKDALSVAAIHSAAFPGTRLSVLGICFLEQFYHRHFGLPETIQLGMERDNEIIGFACGGPQGYHTQAVRNLYALTGAIMRHPWVIGRLCYLTFRKPNVPLENTQPDAEYPSISLGSLPSPIFVLRIIAVAENARNTGCAAQLLAEFEERAKARGARSIVLSVLKSNFSARRLYARNRMCPVLENQTLSAMNYGKILVV